MFADLDPTQYHRFFWLSARGEPYIELHRSLKFGLEGLLLMALLLTGEIARSETKFTQSGVFFRGITDAEHVRHLRLQHTTVGGPAPWAKTKTHTDARASSIIWREILVAHKQKLPCLLDLITLQPFFTLRPWGWLLVTSEVLKVGGGCGKQSQEHTYSMVV